MHWNQARSHDFSKRVTLCQTPDLSCLPPRHVLNNVTFYSYSCRKNFKQVGISTMAFAAKNKHIVKAFSLLGFFTQKDEELIIKLK